MVAVPPGTFVMGSPDVEQRWEGYDGEEEPQHEARIDHVLAMGRAAVTVDAFSAFITDTNYDMGESARVPLGQDPLRARFVSQKQTSTPADTSVSRGSSCLAFARGGGCHCGAFVTARRFRARGVRGASTAPLLSRA
jgi:hypothetical protein